MGAVGVACQVIGVILLSIMLGYVSHTHREVEQSGREIRKIQEIINYNNERIERIQDAINRTKEAVAKNNPNH